MLSETLAIVQRHDPDRFACLLFAPPAARETLATLYAFNHELARAREVASQPILALIRLRWWQEVVEGAKRDHPVARAVRQALAAGQLSQDTLTAMIEARMREAEDAWDEAAWRDYLRGTGGMLVRESSRIMEADPPQAVDLLAVGGGIAAVGLLRNRATHAAQGRETFPAGRDMGWVAGEARRWLGPVRQWPEALVAAVLPVVLARRWLARWDGDPGRRAHDGAHDWRVGWWRIQDRLALGVAAKRRIF